MTDELPAKAVPPTPLHVQYPNVDIARWFAYEHLPPHLQEVSHWFHACAGWILHRLPQCAERTVALRKLLEAKDAAVRAQLSREGGGGA